MKFIENSKIDKKRWDELVSTSPNNNITCYSWYLDATTEKWGAITNEHYSFGIPLPYKNRVFYKQIYQPSFSRNLDFFGDEKFLSEAIEILKKTKSFLFNFPHKLNLKSENRIYQKLNLKYTIDYKTNTKRILKKQADTFNFKVSENTESVTKFYFNNSFNKIKQPKKNKVFLQQLLTNAVLHKKGVAIEAYNTTNEIVAAAFYLLDKSTVYYLIGDSDEENKKLGVMYTLMDFAIQYFKNEYTFFDFGGSNVKSVADFYRKMGGKDIVYFQYKNE